MSLENDIALLKRVPTLALLGADALRILAIGAGHRFVDGDDTLFRDGEAADAAYLIQEGSFVLAPEATPRAEPMIVGPGTLIGELALLTETRWPMTATA